MTKTLRPRPYLAVLREGAELFQVGVGLVVTLFLISLLPLGTWLPETRPLAWTLVLTFFALYVSTALHELGHVVAARWLDFSVHGFSVGPLRLHRKDRHWRLSLQSPMSPFAGQAYVYPKDDHDLVRRYRLMFVAGPLANIATALVCLTVLTVAPDFSPLFNLYIVSLLAVSVFLSSVVNAALSQAFIQGTRDIDLQKLDSGKGGSSPELPPFVDCFVRQVPAPGDPPWLVLDGIAAQGGSVFGRFTHLDEDLRTYLQTRAAERAPGIIFADLTYSDRFGHVNNVAIHAPLYSHETSVAASPGVDFSHHIPLSDVLVGVHGNRFYFRSLTRGTQLVFCVPHVLNPALAPNPVRFLQEVSRSYAPQAPYWNWSLFENLEVLPRVRFGRVVLAPARWRVPDAVRHAPEAWETHFAEFRSRTRLPRFVLTGSTDNRLLLDLDAPLHRTLLSHIVRRESPVLEEAIGGYAAADIPDADGGHHFAEYVVSLPLQNLRYPQAPVKRVYEEIPLSERHLLPLQGCSYLKLYGAANFQEDVLIALRNRLATMRAAHSHWFFIRYADPDPHLRLRVFGKPEELPELTARLLQTIDDLRGKGFLTKAVLDTYDRELERYGGSRAIRACERIFGTDSESVIDLLQESWLSGDDQIATVAVTADLLLAALGLSPVQREEILAEACVGYRQEFGATPDDRKNVERILSEDLRRWRALVIDRLCAAYPAGSTADAPLQRVLHDYRMTMRQWAGPLCQALAPETPNSHPALLTSLVHMHANRLGLDRWQEFRALHLMLKVHKGLKHHWPVGIDQANFELRERSLA